MMRQHCAFACDGSTLIGSIDHGPAATGLLIVTGGNELRAGAWAGQAQFAARIAAEGFPVFRFDRRGVGDSDGPNGGFQSSARDIAAALAEFRRRCPAMVRVVGLGNCDAGSALMLGKGTGFDALVLSNPWTFENEEAPPPPEVIRGHYRRRLRDPAALLRLLRGQVSLGRLFAGLRDAGRAAPPPTTLVREMAAGVKDFSGPIVFLVAERDRTGQAFVAAWPKDDRRIRRCPQATHSYVEPQARDWLVEEALDVLRG